MWGKRKRPAPDQLAPRDDIAEARNLRAAVRTDLIELQNQMGLVRKMTDTLIDRQGRNHYIELLYEHIPKGAA